MALEFFILPYSKNHYAEWLARQDPWNNRHVYLPLECKLFVPPSLLADTKAKLRSHGHLHTVGHFYREMSEAYSREADQLVKLRLWECLWRRRPSQVPHQLIPFCQRAEIGKQVDKKGQEQMYQYGTGHRNRAGTYGYAGAPATSDYNLDDEQYEDSEAHFSLNGHGSLHGQGSQDPELDGERVDARQPVQLEERQARAGRRRPLPGLRTTRATTQALREVAPAPPPYC